MLFAVVFACFGLIIGSFLNVVILRHSIRSLAGRSGCLSCRAQLHAVDLVPIVSWLALRGRCRACGSGISMLYPLVEGATALAFGILGGAGLPPLASGLSCVIAALLIAIAAYDARHTIIPDRWVYSAALAAFVLALIEGAHALPLILVAGPIAALPLFALWLVSRGRWMGLGDAKLALAIGWLLGPVYGMYAVGSAFVIGAALSLAILVPLPHYVRVLKKAGIVRSARAASYTMKSEVPFGPFLILSCFIVWFALLYALPLPGAFW